MSIGLGKPDKNNPRGQDGIKRTIEVTHKNGKYVMLGIGTPWHDEVDKYVKMGIDMIEVGGDKIILYWEGPREKLSRRLKANKY